MHNDQRDAEFVVAAPLFAGSGDRSVALERNLRCSGSVFEGQAPSVEYCRVILCCSPGIRGA